MFRFASLAGPVCGSAMASILFALPPGAAATPPSESGFAASTAEIVGEVTDPQGLRVPGADVILTLASGEIRETTSDAAGSFRFDTLPEGVHRLTVLGRGFADRTVEITVGAAGEVRISIPLHMSFAERVTVTGQQQERSLQDEPTSVALVSGAQLDSGTDTDLYRLVAMTPNVNSSSDVRGFSIRGISQQGFGPEGGLLLGVKLDGATVQGYQGTFFGPFSTWDMDRVEIFRGPQSTQQGRNALAGAIVMKSADPEYRTAFRVRGRFGNFGATQGSAVLNVPIVAGKAAFRLAVDNRRSDGFVENPTRGEDAYDYRDYLAVRMKLRFDPSTRFRGLLTYQATESRGGDGAINVDRFPEERVNISDHPAEDGSEHHNVTLALAYDLGHRLSLESTSSVYQHAYRREEDLDQTPLAAGVLDYTTDDEWMTQEFLLRYQGPGRRSGVLGLYLADLTDTLQADAAGPGELAGLPPGFTLTSFFNTEETTRNAALFGEFDLGLADVWTLTLGARYDDERRQTTNRQGVVSDPPLPQLPPAGPPQELDASYRAFLPKATLTRDWNDSLSTSVGWQRGYRAGGQSIAVLSQRVSDFEPEFTSNVEFALRAAAPDRRWFFNGNAFYTDWTNQQVRVMTDLGLPVDTVTVNAGESTVRGLEAQAGYWFDPRVQFYGSLGLLSTRFDEFRDGERNFTGNEFPYAPAWSWMTGISVRLDDNWSGNAEIAAQADAFSNSGNDARFRVGERTLVNSRFGYQRGNFGVFVFGRNLLDEAYLLQAWQPTAPIFSALGRAGEPRTIGIELDLSF